VPLAADDGRAHGDGPAHQRFDNISFVINLDRLGGPWGYGHPGGRPMLSSQTTLRQIPPAGGMSEKRKSGSAPSAAAVAF
jgi:hypothetical protein